MYVTDTGQEIQLTVKFEEFDRELPFLATPYDPMPYGVDLYNDALAGNFGDIAPYVPPAPPENPISVTKL